MFLLVIFPTEMSVFSSFSCNSIATVDHMIYLNIKCIHGISVMLFKPVLYIPIYRYNG